MVREDNGEQVTLGVNPEERSSTTSFPERSRCQAHSAARETMRPKFPTVAFVSKEQIRDGIGVGCLGNLGCLVRGHHMDGRGADNARPVVVSSIEDHL